MSSKVKYYAVKNGRKTGIFYSWAECQKQINGFSNAIYKSFLTEEEAQKYLNRSEGDDGGLYSSMLDYGEEEFKETSLVMPDTAFCFVDGSFSAEENNYSCGVALFYKGSLHKTCSCGKDASLKGMHNVAGEILGAMEAVKLAERLGASKAVIFHDYAGIKEWPADNWSANTAATLNYKAFMQEAATRIKIEYVKVEGHSGVPMNELVDSLAKSALGITV